MYDCLSESQKRVKDPVRLELQGVSSLIQHWEAITSFLEDREVVLTAEHFSGPYSLYYFVITGLSLNTINTEISRNILTEFPECQCLFPVVLNKRSFFPQISYCFIYFHHNSS